MHRVKWARHNQKKYTWLRAEEYLNAYTCESVCTVHIFQSGSGHDLWKTWLPLGKAAREEPDSVFVINDHHAANHYDQRHRHDQS